MKRALLLMAFLLSAGDFASAQSLPETAAYILSEGNIEVGDMKEIDQDTISAPFQAPNDPIMNMIGAPRDLKLSFIIKVLDRNNCVIQVTSDPDQPAIPDNVIKALADTVHYFNNIIVGEATYQNFGMSTKFTFPGEDSVWCNCTSSFLHAPRYFGDPLANERGPKNNKQCFRTWSASVQNEKLQRWLKAVEFLYANYCSPAKRKGAF